MIDQKHYARLGIEPIDIMKLNFTKSELRGFIKGNLVKYSHRKKGQELKDAQKLQVYSRWLELMYDKTQVDEGRALDRLINKIPKHKYEMVISEGRGGAYVAAQVAYALDVPLFIGSMWYKAKGKVLYVDDIEDTSATVRQAMEEGFDTAVLVQKKSSERLAKYVGMQIKTKKYINFTFQSKEKK